MRGAPPSVMRNRHVRREVKRRIQEDVEKIKGSTISQNLPIRNFYELKFHKKEHN